MSHAAANYRVYTVIRGHMANVPNEHGAPWAECEWEC